MIRQHLMNLARWNQTPGLMGGPLIPLINFEIFFFNPGFHYRSKCRLELNPFFFIFGPSPVCQHRPQRGHLSRINQDALFNFTEAFHDDTNQ